MPIIHYGSIMGLRIGSPLRNILLSALCLVHLLGSAAPARNLSFGTQEARAEPPWMNKLIVAQRLKLAG